MKSLLKYLWSSVASKLAEKSTWVGFLAILSTGGLTIAPELSTNIVAVLSGLFGCYEVIKREKENK